MTAALLIAALMFGTAVAIWGIRNIYLVLTAPDNDMLDEVDTESEYLRVLS